MQQHSLCNILTLYATTHPQNSQQSCAVHSTPQGLLENFSKNPGLATPFYKAYYLQLLREVGGWGFQVMFQRQLLR